MRQIIDDICKIEKELQKLEQFHLEIEKKKEQDRRIYTQRESAINKDYNDTIVALCQSEKETNNNYQKGYSERDKKKSFIENKYTERAHDVTYAIHNRYAQREKECKKQLQWIEDALEHNITASQIKKILSKHTITQEKKDFSQLQNSLSIAMDSSFKTSVGGLLHVNGSQSKSEMLKQFVCDAIAHKLYLEKEISEFPTRKKTELSNAETEQRRNKQWEINELTKEESNEALRKQEQLNRIQTQKQNALQKKSNELKKLEDAREQSIQNINLQIAEFQKKLQALVQSKLICEFVSRTKENIRGCGSGKLAWQNNDYDKPKMRFVIGRIYYPIQVRDKMLLDYVRPFLNNVLEHNFIRIPFVLPHRFVLKMFIQYKENLKQTVDMFVQYIILQKYRCAELDTLEVYYMDLQEGGRRMGIFNAPVDENKRIGIEHIGVKDDFKHFLRRMIDEVNRISKELGMYRSIYQYNECHEDKIKEKIIVLSDIAEEMDKSDWDLLKIITQNADNCGIHILMISQKSISEMETIKTYEKNDLSYLKTQFLYYFMFAPDKTYMTCNNRSYEFITYNLDTCHMDFLEQYRRKIKESLIVSNKWEDYYDLETPKPYEDSTKYLELPIMVEAKPKGKPVSFIINTNNSGPHTLITGGTGSGKTGLLRLIIASVVYQYHPDDVEIWLIDYGKSTYKDYLRERPKHMRFLAAENTTNFTASFLDYLKNYVDQRIRSYGDLKEFKEYRSVHGTRSLPRILIVIDEFHNMTQHVNEHLDSEYKHILENALTEYRKHGVSFIICDQSSENLGLSFTAREQLMNRIALKLNSMDYTEALACGMNELTEDIVDFIKSMPRGGFLCKNECVKNKVIDKYVALNYGADESVFAKLFQISNARNHNLQHDTTLMTIGVNENRILWDKMLPMIKTEINKNPNQISLCLGTPTSFEPIFSIGIEHSYRNNILIAGQDRRLALDLMASMMCSLQMTYHAEIVVIMNPDETDRVFYDRYLPVLNVKTYDTYESICTFVKEQQSWIEERRRLRRDTFVFWIGFRDLCEELSRYPSFNRAQTVSQSKDVFSGETIHVSEDDIARELGENAEFAALFEEFGGGMNQQGGALFEEPIVFEPKVECYDANSDIRDLHENGGKFGLFHITHLAAPSDIRRTELRYEVYRHKLALYMSNTDCDGFGIDTRVKVGDALKKEDKKQTVLYCDGTPKGTVIFRPFEFEKGE